MEKKKTAVSASVFRHFSAPAAAVCSILAAVLALLPLILRLSPSFMRLLFNDQMAGGVLDPRVVETWLGVNTGITAILVLYPAIMGIAIIIALRGRPDRGTHLLTLVAEATAWLLNVFGVILAVLFVYQVGRYSIENFRGGAGLQIVYAMLFSEAVMMVLACVLFFSLRKFLGCVSRSAASIGYTLSCEVLDDKTIPSFTATGFLLLGIGCFLLATDRYFTLTIVYNAYVLLTAEHPGQLLETAALVVCGIGNILLYIYLRRYKRICERALFETKE